MSVVQLPTWIECAALVDLEKEGHGHASVLEKFIYDNEPAGKKEALAWREFLGDVIDEAEARL